MPDSPERQISESQINESQISLEGLEARLRKKLEGTLSWSIMKPYATNPYQALSDIKKGLERIKKFITKYSTSQQDENVSSLLKTDSRDEETALEEILKIMAIPPEIQEQAKKQEQQRQRQGQGREQQEQEQQRQGQDVTSKIEQITEKIINTPIQIDFKDVVGLRKFLNQLNSAISNKKMWRAFLHALRQYYIGAPESSELYKTFKGAEIAINSFLKNVNLQIAQRLQNKPDLKESVLSTKKKKARSKLWPYENLVKWDLRIIEYESDFLRKLTARLDKLGAEIMKVYDDFFSNYQTSLDIKGQEPQEYKLDSLLNLTSHPDEEVRKTAAKAVTEMLKEILPAATAYMNWTMRRGKIIKATAGYESLDVRTFIQHNVPPSAVKKMIKIVLGSCHISQVYYHLKKLIINKNQKPLEYYERDLLPIPFEQQKLSYPDVAFMLLKSLYYLDPQLAKIFVELHEQGSIDAYSREGKKAGARCLFVHPKLSPSVLLNLNKKGLSILNASMLAHEIGHALQAILVGQSAKSNILLYRIPIPIAEIASTFMELLLLEEIQKEATKEEKLALLLALSIYKIEKATFLVFRQTAFHLFPLKLFELFKEKGELTSEEIGKVFEETLKEYLGESITFNEDTRLWWAYIEHFFIDFYTYTYAMGYLISLKLISNLRNNPNSKGQIIEFFKANASQSPEEILKKTLGIDINDPNCWIESIEEIKDTLKETIYLCQELGYINNQERMNLLRELNK